MTVILFIALLLSALCGTASEPMRDPVVSSNAGQGHSLTGNRIMSLKPPVVFIDVDEQLPHAGILNFTLKEVAQVQRYLYLRANGRKIQRLLIVQFESILPGVKGSYSFPLTNATTLGKYDYETSVGVFNFHRAIAANPGAEAEVTKDFLEKNGLSIDNDFLVARFARIVGQEKRKELIFFYYEDPTALGLTAADVNRASRTAEVEERLRAFTARAVKSFQIRDMSD